MAKARVILKRRKAVTNIRKITRTMQLIATAQYQKNYQRAVRTKPFAEKLEQVLADLSSIAGQVEHPLLNSPEKNIAAAGRTNAPPPPHVVLILSSNRGLCGGYNAGILRKATEHSRELQLPRERIEFHTSGKKGIAYLKFIGVPIAGTYPHLADKPDFAAVAEVATGFMDRFTAGQIAGVDVVYQKFHNVAQQRPMVTRLLPFEAASTAGSAQPGSADVQYEFSPEPAQLLAELLPAAVRTRLFQCFMDALISEQIARMVAMKSATDAAGKLIKAATRAYNRARQTQITTEIMEIVGGAEAMNG